MPTGVQVTIGASAGAGGGDPTSDAQFFLAGTSLRGDTTKPIIAQSYSEFEDLVGPRTTTGFAHDAVRAFFAENGGVGRVLFARTVGPAAGAPGSVILKDRSGAGGLNTLVVSAASPGPWSSGVSLVVTDGILTGTYNIAVVYGGVTVETFANLASPAAAVQAMSASNWVRAVNSGSVTAAPGNNPVNGTFTLSAGTDDLSNVAQSHLTAALAQFTAEYGPGIVAIPGQPQTVAAAIAAHCATFHRVGVVSPAAGTSVSTAQTLARGLRATSSAQNIGMVYPWVTLPADGEAGIRLVSPEGAYAGRRAAAIGQVGVWQPPAGDLGQFNYVSGPEITLTATQRDALVDDAIIPIVANPSPRIYGDRSLSSDEVTWRFLSYSGLANSIAYEASLALDSFVGRAIDGVDGEFFASMLTALTGVVSRIEQAGGLVPGADDPGYVIDMEVNTPTTVALGQANAVISFRPPSIAELIKIRLTKSGFTPSTAA